MLKCIPKWLLVRIARSLMTLVTLVMVGCLVWAMWPAVLFLFALTAVCACMAWLDDWLFYNEDRD